MGSLYFILDTASSGTTVSPDIVERFSLPREQDEQTGQGMGGEVSVAYYTMQSLAAGPLLIKNAALPSIPAPSLASHPVAGLAGVDLFGEKLAIWRLQAGCVFIDSSGTRPKGSGWQRIRTNWLQPWKVLVPIRIGRTEGWALLDTGAQYSAINTAFAEQSGLETSDFEAAGLIYGIDGRELVVKKAVIGQAQAGPWQWNDTPVRVGNLPVFQRLGESGTPLAILGMDWLSGRDFAIDYGTRAVWMRSGI